MIKGERAPFPREQKFLLFLRQKHLSLLHAFLHCLFIWGGRCSDDHSCRPSDKSEICYSFLTEDLSMGDFKIVLWESTLKMKECLLNLQDDNYAFSTSSSTVRKWVPLKFNACVQMTHESGDKNISILRTTFWKSPWGYPSVLIAKTCAGRLSNENLRWKGPYLSYLKNDFRRLVFSFIYWLFELSNSS